NLDSYLVRLNAYQDFIEDAGFEDLYSYPRFYLFRWCMLKHYQELLDAAASGPQTAATYLDRASVHLQEIRELDAVVGNRYGLSRAKLLTLLMHAAQEAVEPAAWAALATEMGACGYRFEERLGRHLATRPTLTHTELRAIFRFYPFVQQ